MLRHHFFSFLALLIQFYHFTHASRMPHREAVGNPFVAHGTVLFHQRGQQGLLPDSFALRSQAFSLNFVADFRPHLADEALRIGLIVRFDHGS